MNAQAPESRMSMTLEDRYMVEHGWLYMTGTQALIRLPIQQRMRDAAGRARARDIVPGLSQIG